MKNKILIILLFVFLLLFTSNIYANVNNIEFNDLSEDVWYYPAVIKILDLNIVSGYSDNTFRPNNNITRAEMAQVVSNLLDYINLEYKQSNSESIYKQSEVDMIANTISSTAIIYSGLNVGGGVFIGDKHVLTAYHILTDTKNINIISQNGSYYSGKLIKYSNEYDLALIEIIDANQKEIKYINLADDIYLAETVFTIGHPKQLHFTVAKGIVSSLSRRIDNADYNQLDIAVSPGSSGGAVINSNGELVGITTLVGSNANGVAFMARLEDIKEFLDR